MAAGEKPGVPPSTPAAPPREREDDALPPLPELDDDGTNFDDDGGLDVPVGHEHDEHALDDATAEHDPIEAWVVEGATHEHERGLLDDTEASEDRVDIGAHDAGLVAEEGNLLEGSDEPDGRDVTAEEAGIFEASEGTSDDGGAEGTGEDPALALDDQNLLPMLVVEPADDDGVEDESALEDGGEARLRASLERQPWPSRADVAWKVEELNDAPLDRDVRRSAPPPPEVRLPGPFREDAVVAVDGSLVAVARHGEPLAISIDGGARYVRLPSCASATAVAVIPGHPGGRALVVSLYDVVRDVSALAVVRIAEGSASTFVAELVADVVPTLPEDDGDDQGERARVESLSARLVAGGLVEVVARGRTFAIRARG
jgi:hypothetical protein